MKTTSLHLLLACLFLVTACAHRTTPMLFEPLVITGSAELEESSGLSNAEIIEQALQRRLRGDTYGARMRLQLVLDQDPHPPERAAALYQLGLCHERDQRFADGLAVYDELVQLHADTPEAQNGWFRRALCLEGLGRHREAKRSLARVSTGEGLDLHDRLTLDLQRGISLVRSGRKRAGLALLNQALAASQGSDLVTYLRAKALVTRAWAQLDAAEDLHFDCIERKQGQRLELRSSLLSHAQDDVIAAGHLEEPLWLMEGLLVVGDGFRSLHEALLASRPPRRLTMEQRVIFREQLRKHSQVLLTKAWKRYDEGLSLAASLHYSGRPVPQLQAARASIDLAEVSAP